jgi:hypothetical protein
MLLFFPHHNHTIAMGCYRAMICADKWMNQCHVLESLVVVCEHLAEIINPYRGMIALEIFYKNIFPFLQLLTWFEEEALEGSMGTNNNNNNSTNTNSSYNNNNNNSGPSSPISSSSFISTENITNNNNNNNNNMGRNKDMIANKILLLHDSQRSQQVM